MGQHKNIVITGASRGLGQTLAIYFAEDGATLHLCARNLDTLNDTVKLIKDRVHATVYTYKMDICNIDEIAAAAIEIEKNCPSIDLLINNGAKWHEGSLLECDDREIIETMNSAGTGTILVTKYLLSHVQKSEQKHIVSIISACGLPNYQHDSASAIFHAAKHAQSAFGESLRYELRDKKVRLSNIYPPDFDDINQASDEWSENRKSENGQNMCNKQILESIIYAISTPSICNVNSIVLENWKN